MHQKKTEIKLKFEETANALQVFLSVCLQQSILDSGQLLMMLFRLVEIWISPPRKSEWQPMNWKKMYAFFILAIYNIHIIYFKRHQYSYQNLLFCFRLLYKDSVGNRYKQYLHTRTHHTHMHTRGVSISSYCTRLFHFCISALFSLLLFYSHVQFPKLHKRQFVRMNQWNLLGTIFCIS